MAYKKPDDFKPTPHFPQDHKFYGKRRCMAWSTRNGRQCMGLATKNSGEKQKCRVHGGNALKGIANPNTKTGEHSSYLPKRLIPDFEAALKRGDILQLHNEIAVTRARLDELYRQLNDQSSEEIFQAMHAKVDAIDRLQKVIERANLLDDATERVKRSQAARDKITILIAEIFDLIRLGSQDYQQWNDIEKFQKHLNIMIKTERQLEIDQGTLIRAERVALMLTTLMASIQANVRDRKSLQAIQNDYISITQSADY